MPARWISCDHSPAMRCTLSYHMLALMHSVVHPRLMNRYQHIITRHHSLAAAMDYCLLDPSSCRSHRPYSAPPAARYVQYEPSDRSANIPAGTSCISRLYHCITTAVVCNSSGWPVLKYRRLCLTSTLDCTSVFGEMMSECESTSAAGCGLSKDRSRRRWGRAQRSCIDPCRRPRD